MPFLQLEEIWFRKYLGIWLCHGVKLGHRNWHVSNHNLRNYFAETKHLPKCLNSWKWQWPKQRKAWPCKIGHFHSPLHSTTRLAVMSKMYIRQCSRSELFNLFCKTISETFTLILSDVTDQCFICSKVVPFSLQQLYLNSIQKII